MFVINSIPVFIFVVVTSVRTIYAGECLGPVKSLAVFATVLFFGSALTYKVPNGSNNAETASIPAAIPAETEVALETFTAETTSVPGAISAGTEELDEAAARRNKESAEQEEAIAELERKLKENQAVLGM